LIVLKNSLSEIYGLKPGETWWAASDLGWTVGHSYCCYGPLLARNPAVLYEGKPVGTPDPGAYFRVLSEHKVVSMFVAPTALRAIRQQDQEGKYASKYNLDHFKNLFVAGEHCDHETMDWVKKILNTNRVFDHYWQTETGWPITSTCVGLEEEDELKKGLPKGVSGKPVPGYDIKILKDNKEEAGPNELGRIVIKLPLPPGTLLSLWKNDDLFYNSYFEEYPGYYDTADVGFKCPNGYITVQARADDVINVAGHRISSSSIEEAILEHSELSECAVVELKDKLKGSIPFGFLIRNNKSKTESKDLIEQVVKLVRESIGPVAAFKQAVIIDKLPKTRSGKIARNTLKSLINNQPFKAPVTLEDSSVFDNIIKTLKTNGYHDISSPNEQ
jgi:propionyl-CoA synthetase